MIIKMTINKKIKRTLWESKAQTLGSLVLIILTCMLYTMFNQLNNNMADLSSSFEAEYIQEDASFITDKKLTNLADLESRFNLVLEEGGSFDYPVSDEVTLRVFSENTKVNLPAIIEGKALNGNGILVDPAFAKAQHLNLGDSVKIKDQTFTLMGTMSLPNYIYPLKSDNDLLSDPNRFGIAVISKDAFAKLNVGNRFYAVKFLGDPSTIDQRMAGFKDALTASIHILKWTNIEENPRVAFVSAKIESISKVSSSMPIAILLLTCILTGIVIWRLLKRESPIIGTLYALGYRQKEIVTHYLLYPLSIALIGGLVGTALGALTLKPMLQFMVSYFNMPIDKASFSLKLIIISILLPVLFLGLSGYLVILRALKFTPVELMRGGADAGKVGFLERKLTLGNLKFATKFKIREQLRSVPRSLFLLFGVIMATMLLLYGFAAKSSLDHLLKDTFENTYRYQYEYVFNSLQLDKPQSGEGFSSAPFTLKSDRKSNIQLYGINPTSPNITLKDKAGKTLTVDQVILTRPLADRLKRKPGDTIELVGKLDDREYDLKVGKIAETFVGEYIFMPLSQFNTMLNYPAGSYMGLFSQEKLNIPENKLLAQSTIGDSKKSFDDLILPLRYTIGTIALMSFAIGLIVVYVVTSLIIEENKQNISLMKILGYRRKELNALILNSSSFLILLGYLIGIPLILLSLSAMLNSVTKNLNLTFPVSIDFSYILIGFLIIYLTYEISKALSKRKVHRIPMTEILKSRFE